MVFLFSALNRATSASTSAAVILRAVEEMIEPQDIPRQHLIVPSPQPLLQYQRGPGGVVDGELKAGPALFAQPSGRDLLQHSPLVEEAVMRGDIGQLGEDMA